MTTQEKIEIMQAFFEGKEVEYANKGSKYWNDLSFKIEPTWNWEANNYRIKPKLTYIPFTFEDREMFREKWMKYKFGINSEVFINFINEWKVGVDGTYYSYYELFDLFTFIDGTPCGKLQQNN